MNSKTPWMDEGINKLYRSKKCWIRFSARNTDVLNMAGATAGERELQRSGYTYLADLDPIAQKAYDLLQQCLLFGITYGKTASVLLTLEVYRRRTQWLKRCAPTL